MSLLWLAQRLAQNRLARNTADYLERLAELPELTSRHAGARLFAHMDGEQGPNVILGKTMRDELVKIPISHLIRSCGLVTGGTGTGKSMFATLFVEAILRELPRARDMAFGVLDAKGELFERALYLVARRLGALGKAEREALLQRIVIVDFSGRQAISPYNILARWPGTETDYFLTSRLETLLELLPAGEKLSLRGAGILKNALALLSECNVPLTQLDALLSNEDFRCRLIQESNSEPVRSYFQRHFQLEAKQTVAALRARMDALFASEGIRLALSGSSSPDFCRLQNEGKIVLVNCAGPTITRGVRQLLQGLVLSDVRQGIFARPNDPRVSYLWFADEAQNFFLTRQQEENIADILTMARSFGSFFVFLCQNISSAVPDARVLETLHTNIRWSMTFRSTPRDAAFLRGALPVTGQRYKPEANPFREPRMYSTEEERALVLNEIAGLPDRVGYLWLKAYSTEAIKMHSEPFDLPRGAAFREIVDSILHDHRIGERLSRTEYERLIEKRACQWQVNESESSDSGEPLASAHHPEGGQP